MDHYIDITLLPDSEFPPTILMNSLYAKFHKALCELNSTAIGVSFPNFRGTLGNLLRIHGKNADLNRLSGLNWLGGMHGYCLVSDIKPVPTATKYRIVKRKQMNMSQSALRRLTRRGSITEGEEKEYRARMLTKFLDKPYIELMSSSNGHKHRRYIEFGELVDAPVLGDFDQFGLSKTATIPWFG